jgi:hypothetical protein
MYVLYITQKFYDVLRTHRTIFLAITSSKIVHVVFRLYLSVPLGS